MEKTLHVPPMGRHWVDIVLILHRNTSNSCHQIALCNTFLHQLMLHCWHAVLCWPETEDYQMFEDVPILPASQDL